MEQSHLEAIAHWLEVLQGLERDQRDLSEPARIAGAFTSALDQLNRDNAFDEESTAFLAYLQSLAPGDPPHG